MDVQGEEDSLGIVADLFQHAPTPPSFLSISHVDPLLLCLKFLIGAEGQAMFITMPRGGEILRLNQIKTKLGLSGDSLHWLPLVIVLAAMVESVRFYIYIPELGIYSSFNQLLWLN